MKKVVYIFKIIKRLNFDKLKEAVNKINKKTKKAKLLIIIDIMWCAIRYGAGYNDYLHFGYYDLKAKERKTYISRSYNNKLVAELNNKSKIHILDNKNEFNELYSKYLKREWLYLNNNETEFSKWLKNKNQVIVKPINDSGGHGIELINVKDYKTSKSLYNYLVKKKLLLVEELIKQHNDLAKIYSKSVNTIRLITIHKGNKVEFLTAFLRVGNGGFVDNTCSGGFVIPIDLKTGKTTHPGIGFDDKPYTKHPLTNKDFIGIQIPMWKECLAMVKEACSVVPEVQYTGWDVAVTNDGPCLVEGNPYPGYFYQFPEHLPNKIGYLPRAEEILSKLNLK